MQELGTRPRSFISGNICSNFRYSDFAAYTVSHIKSRIQQAPFLCSEVYTNKRNQDTRLHLDLTKVENVIAGYRLEYFYSRAGTLVQAQELSGLSTIIALQEVPRYRLEYSPSSLSALVHARVYYSSVSLQLPRYRLE